MAPNDTEKNFQNGEAEDHQMLEVKLDKNDVLPSPVSANVPAKSASKSSLSASAIIPVWITLSSAVIIYNNYLYNTLQFKYPVFLVTWHLTFAVSLTIYAIRRLYSPTCERVGYWHPCAAEDNTPPRRSKGCTRIERDVPAVYPPHRPPLQCLPHPLQHRLSLPQRRIHPDAQGSSSFPPDIRPSTIETCLTFMRDIGVHPSGHPPHLMDLPSARAE